jgi:hypothetical protein
MTYMAHERGLLGHLACTGARPLAPRPLWPPSSHIPRQVDASDPEDAGKPGRKFGKEAIDLRCDESFEAPGSKIRISHKA